MKYAVSLLMRGKTATGSSSLWELVVLCIEGDDEDDAREKAHEVSGRYRSEYKTAEGGMMSWKLEAIHEIAPLDPFPPAHGSELFSCFLKEREARSFMEPIDE